MEEMNGLLAKERERKEKQQNSNRCSKTKIE